jgi:DNA-binding XRE family transcriptional regulator
MTARNPVKEWRTEHGFTTREAAGLLMCSRTAMISWEAEPSRAPGYILLAMQAITDGHRITKKRNGVHLVNGEASPL